MDAVVLIHPHAGIAPIQPQTLRRPRLWSCLVVTRDERVFRTQIAFFSHRPSSPCLPRTEHAGRQSPNSPGPAPGRPSDGRGGAGSGCGSRTPTRTRRPTRRSSPCRCPSLRCTWSRCPRRPRCWSSASPQRTMWSEPPAAQPSWNASLNLASVMEPVVVPSVGADTTFARKGSRRGRGRRRRAQAVTRVVRRGNPRLDGAQRTRRRRTTSRRGLVRHHGVLHVVLELHHLLLELANDVRLPTAGLTTSCVPDTRKSLELIWQ
jgi:hypothetical protein